MCARYALAPNSLRYCGPESKDGFDQKTNGGYPDGGLVEDLRRFETLYPYLEVISRANDLRDPFDPRVVEAYWIGNRLLDQVTPQETYIALHDTQQLARRLTHKDQSHLYSKIDLRARLHHSFHVFNVFMRTGHHTVEHTVESMDQCRIGWGKITNSKIQEPSYKQYSNQKIQLSSQRLVYEEGKLWFEPVEREVINMNMELGKKLKIGDWVSYHWGMVCDKISNRQTMMLAKYTHESLTLANQTL
jgi:hydrogenase maturation factor